MPPNPLPIGTDQLLQELEVLLRIHEETKIQILSRLVMLPPSCGAYDLSWISRAELAEKIIGLNVKPDL